MTPNAQEWRRIWAMPLFGGIDREKAEAILREHGCTTCSFADGEVLMSPDVHQKRIGILLKGEATVTTPDPGKETLLRFLSPDEPFGIANLFLDTPFVSIIRAKGACKAFFLTEEAVRALLESDRTFLYRYLSFLSGRICYLNRKIGYLTAGTAERRLALYLSSYSLAEFSLNTSITSLSELLDIGRASLYRAFDKLCEDGLIEKDGRRIRIPDMEALLQAYQ